MINDKTYLYGCILNALIAKGYSEDLVCEKALEITNKAIKALGEGIQTKSVQKGKPKRLRGHAWRSKSLLNTFQT